MFSITEVHSWHRRCHRRHGVAPARGEQVAVAAQEVLLFLHLMRLLLLMQLLAQMRASSSRTEDQDLRPKQHREFVQNR